MHKCVALTCLNMCVLFNLLNIRLSYHNKAFRKYTKSSLNLPAILPESVVAKKDGPLPYMEGRS